MLNRFDQSSSLPLWLKSSSLSSFTMVCSLSSLFLFRAVLGMALSALSTLDASILKSRTNVLKLDVTSILTLCFRFVRLDAFDWGLQASSYFSQTTFDRRVQLRKVWIEQLNCLLKLFANVNQVRNAFWKLAQLFEVIKVIWSKWKQNFQKIAILPPLPFGRFQPLVLCSQPIASTFCSSSSIASNSAQSE